MRILLLLFIIPFAFSGVCQVKDTSKNVFSMPRPQDNIMIAEVVEWPNPDLRTIYMVDEYDTLSFVWKGERAKTINDTIPSYIVSVDKDSDGLVAIKGYLVRSFNYLTFQLSEYYIDAKKTILPKKYLVLFSKKIE